MQNNPHRRWFQDKYNIPQSDPRFYDLTDIDIMLDFLAYEEARTIRYEEDEDESEFRDTGENDSTPLAPNSSRNLTVSADKAEFKRWYQSNIGEFPE